MQTLYKTILFLIAGLTVNQVFAQEVKNTIEKGSTSIFGDQQFLLFALFLVMIIFWVIIILVLKSTIRSLTSKKELWADVFKNPKAWIIGFIFLESTTMYGAETTNKLSVFSISDEIIWILIITNVLLGISTWVLVSLMKKLVGMLKGEVDVEAEPDFVESIVKNLTKATPIEKEAKILMDHEYDGIRELDNVLPPWWVYMFYATILFAFVYVGYYHFGGGGKLQAEEYNEQMAIAQQEKEAYLKKAANLVDESNVTILTQKAGIEAGKGTFTTFCAACHGGLGEGGVGPNLTDEFWINGGDIKSIFKTIKYGVTTKGMKSWKDDLTPGQIQEVSSFITTLKGTNPPNGKAPQGDKYSEVTTK